MSEGEVASVIIRIVMAFALGGLFALMAWWGMGGPAAGAAVLAIGLFITLLIDIGRHAR